VVAGIVATRGMIGVVAGVAAGHVAGAETESGISV
jgi:hypothetical protein